MIFFVYFDSVAVQVTAQRSSFVIFQTVCVVFIQNIPERSSAVNSLAVKLLFVSETLFNGPLQHSSASRFCSLSQLLIRSSGRKQKGNRNLNECPVLSDLFSLIKETKGDGQ